MNNEQSNNEHPSNSRLKTPTQKKPRIDMQGTQN